MMQIDRRQFIKRGYLLPSIVGSITTPAACSFLQGGSFAASPRAAYAVDFENEGEAEQEEAQAVKYGTARGDKEMRRPYLTRINRESGLNGVRFVYGTGDENIVSCYRGLGKRLGWTNAETQEKFLGDIKKHDKKLAVVVISPIEALGRHVEIPVLIGDPLFEEIELEGDFLSEAVDKFGKNGEDASNGLRIGNETINYANAHVFRADTLLGIRNSLSYDNQFSVFIQGKRPVTIPRLCINLENYYKTLKELSGSSKSDFHEDFVVRTLFAGLQTWPLSEDTLLVRSTGKQHRIKPPPPKYVA